MEYERLDVGFEKAFVVWDEPLREAASFAFLERLRGTHLDDYDSTNGALRLSFGIDSHIPDLSFIF